jgi:hypothetical protein
MKTIQEIKTAVLTEKDAAYYVGVSPTYLARCRRFERKHGYTYGPYYLKMPSNATMIRYRIADLDHWLRENLARNHWKYRDKD